MNNICLTVYITTGFNMEFGQFHYGRLGHVLISGGQKQLTYLESPALTSIHYTIFAGFQ